MRRTRNFLRYKHFNKDERNELAILLKKGYSRREIAGVLGRSPASVSREVKRNSVKGEYVPDKAQYKAYVKRWHSKYQGMKIRQDRFLENYLHEKIKRGHRQKLRKGIWPGFAPLGYFNNQRTKEIDLDKEKSSFIRKAFKLYVTGDYTLKSIKQFLADNGITSYRKRPLSVSCVQRFLKNHFYYGVFKFNNEVY